MRIGVDAGGTFTDFIVQHEDGRLESFKIRSNPKAPHEVILTGLTRAAASVAKNRTVDVVHGSTVATNALLERKGVRTAFVTTAGFEDLMSIGRQNRRELYNLTPAPESPIVPRTLCFGVRERTLHDGSREQAPAVEEVRRLAAKLARLGVRSIAICLLHSYKNAENERQLAHALGGLGYVCASHEVSPEFREYERASATVINAYVGPLMDRYLGALEAGAGRRFRISIMQSNGGFLSAAQARRHAVRTVLSGPAGGVIAAVEMARRSGFRKVLGFDMGGTSTDVSLCDGSPRETTEAMVDGFPVRVPMLDIHTVGAGGGSIARVQEGLLRVGPESAGADPGPACYGAGREATVTDAQVVLGRIDAAQFLGGQMRIDPNRAAAAVKEIARQLRMPPVRAAEGIISVANANMNRAIRAVSIERGFDPREFALVAFGGAGGLHACALASDLDMPAVIVPRFAEGLSALGMLLADRVRDHSAGVVGESGDLERAFQRLEQGARREAAGAGEKPGLSRTADLRYQGQSYEINVPWRSRAAAEAAFHKEHERQYGYAARQRRVEVVTIRVRALVPSKKAKLPEGRTAAKTSGKPLERDIYAGGRWQLVRVMNRTAVPAAGAMGPALITDYGATILVEPGWRARIDRQGNLILRRESAR